MEVARSLMFHMHIPKRFWSDAVVIACYLINRTPTRILSDHSPFEVLNKTKPSLEHLKVFGCVCFVLVPGDQRNKLDPKSTRAVFLGYSPTQKGYKCYVPDTRRILISRDVKFLETTSYFGGQKWEDIKNISASSEDRAANLRHILENLGLSSTNPTCQEEQSPEVPTSQADASRGSTPDHMDQDGHHDPEEGQDEIPEYSGVHDHDPEHEADVYDVEMKKRRRREEEECGGLNELRSVWLLS